MRIALVAPLISPIADRPEGGSQSVVADLARGLVARGHDVVLYACRGSHVDGVPMAPLDIDPAPLRADAFRYGSSATASAAMVSAYRRLYARVGTESWDVIHNHGFDAPAITEAAQLGLAVLHTLHLPPAAGIAAAIAQGRRLVRATWCAGVSRSHTAAWSELTTVEGTLPNGVPVQRISFGATASRRAVVAGRFSPEKGVAEAIAASRLAGWSVDVFGASHDDLYAGEVRALWAHDPAVAFRGPVSRERLWAELGAAAAVVCLSRWDEPYGMVAAEAQAAGTPVVASCRGGLAEIVEDGVTGFLVAPDDLPAAAAAINRAEDLSRTACRRRAESCLDLDRALDAHESLYRRFVAAAAMGAG